MATFTIVKRTPLFIRYSVGVAGGGETVVWTVSGAATPDLLTDSPAGRKLHTFLDRTFVDTADMQQKLFDAPIGRQILVCRVSHGVLNTSPSMPIPRWSTTPGPAPVTALLTIPFSDGGTYYVDVYLEHSIQT